MNAQFLFWVYINWIFFQCRLLTIYTSSTVSQSESVLFKISNIISKLFRLQIFSLKWRGKYKKDGHTRWFLLSQQIYQCFLLQRTHSRISSYERKLFVKSDAIFLISFLNLRVDMSREWFECFAVQLDDMSLYSTNWHDIFFIGPPNSLEWHTVYRTSFLVFRLVGSNNDTGKVLRPNSWTKSRDLGVFLLTIHSHLYSCALRLQFLKEKGGKLDRK